ncbi:sensor histidine kinase [Actinoplanes derwentensis]|uniref:histidine kinase n=1 Tax=Actinoplanes derwentensis TaxID=113562 RepID=A0A1H2D6B6_9ACTN|nr:sensor histidine kinase [Actinoplanes derwentensis]GID85380.1 two-component sensor histidine kinase [Actinoplanes derwentensis]SDT77786.1 Signal transduction histidine kinase [Actinoplanes derwentensis]
MPSVPPGEWQRPGPTARQRRNDWWTGLTVAAVAVLNLFLARGGGMFDSEHAAALPEQIWWVLVTTLPLTVRRSYPDVVAVAIAVAFIAGQYRGSQEQQITTGVLFAAIYTLGAWGRDRQRSRILRLSIIGVMFGWLALAFVVFSGNLPGPAATASLMINAVVVNVGFFAFCHLMGDAVWNGVLRRHELEEQTEKLRAAQALAAERAVLTERVRIARELHDVVAHHVSVMGIQASACRRALDKDPVRARTALASVEEGARTAVDELRRMLGALRSGEAEQAAIEKIGIERLPEIADRARESGLAVEFAVYGEPVPLPESLSQAAYRIVQEAVTNTLKHAHAQTLDVRVRYLNGQLELDVTDDGRGGSTTAGGMGLVGMRERVSVHDGSLEHGPHPDGGYRVRARFPYTTGATA